MSDKLDLRIAHLERSYDNVQNFMRFMDTKAGVIFALAGVIAGAVVVGPQELGTVGTVFAGLGSLLAIAAMLYALHVVWPAHGPRDPANLTLLFPALDPGAMNDDATKPNIGLILKSKTDEPLSEKLVVDEFASQLSHLHRPIIRKISSLRSSILCMSCALVCVGFSQILGMSVSAPAAEKKLEAAVQKETQTERPNPQIESKELERTISLPEIEGK